MGYVAIGYKLSWNPITVATFSSVIVPDKIATLFIDGLTSMGFDVNSKSNEFAPICQAALNQKILGKESSVFEHLLKLGANPNTECNWSQFSNYKYNTRIPLIWIAISDRIRPLALVRLIIAHGGQAEYNVMINDRQISTFHWTANALVANKKLVSSADKAELIKILVRAGAGLSERSALPNFYRKTNNEYKARISKILNSKIKNTINNKKIHTIKNDTFI
jgi:hypothetical protein